MTSFAQFSFESAAEEFTGLFL